METFLTNTVQVTLDTGINLSAYESLKILYRKPSGVIGFWTAVIHPSNNEYMTKVLTELDLDEVGVWVVQAHVVDVDRSLHLHGRWANFVVRKIIS